MPKIIDLIVTVPPKTKKLKLTLSFPNENQPLFEF
jgi:hypothetical protein